MTGNLVMNMMNKFVETFLFRNQCYMRDQDWHTRMSWKLPALFHPPPFPGVSHKKGQPSVKKLLHIKGKQKFFITFGV